MKLLLNIVTTMLLIPWPILIMMSPMLIAAPGAGKNKGNIVLLLLLLFYPVLFQYPRFVLNALRDGEQRYLSGKLLPRSST